MKSISILLAALLFCNGCATALTNQIAQRSKPVRVEMDGKQILVGVDLFSLDAVGEHPWIHASAALLDAAAVTLAIREADRRWGGDSEHIVNDYSTHYHAETGDNSPVNQGQNNVGNNAGGE